MKLLLFLGAGVSVPSGLPTAAELTEAVLFAAYHHVGKGIFRAGRHPDPTLRGSDVTRCLRRSCSSCGGMICAISSDVGYYPHRGGFRSSGAIYPGPTT